MAEIKDRSTYSPVPQQDPAERNITFENGICQPNGNRFASNHVTTSSYTWYNFLFKNLYEQFQSIPNVYFFWIGCLQSTKIISVTGGYPDIYPVLAAVMGVSAIRAAFEDYQKHQADKKRNSQMYERLNKKGWEKISFGDIQVGHLIKLTRNQMIPADMLLMGSSLEKNHCFLDLANLNGETRLEVLNPIPSKEEKQNICNNAEEKNGGKLCTFSATLKYGEPNKIFDSFRGTLTSNQECTFINEKVLMMRETVLMNCEYAIGLVVYTGLDSKIEMSQLNGEKSKLKTSQIFRKVNQYQMHLISLQFIICVLCGVFADVSSRMDKQKWYLPHGISKYISLGVLDFFGWLQVLSQMVPISLIVTSEMVKFAMSKFIEWDETMYCSVLNKYVKVNRSTIHEDVGNVDIVFSDKTGTLTQNKMDLRYFMISIPDNSGTGKFGSTETAISRSVERRRNEAKLVAKKQNEGNGKKLYKKQPWTELENSLRETKSSSETSNSPSGGSFIQEVREKLREGGPNNLNLLRFLQHMALSNTVKPYEEDAMIKFQSESAEEDAMIKFAEQVGFRKKQQNPTILEMHSIDKENKEEYSHLRGKETYIHLATFGFTSKRARVTVIYQERKDRDKIHVMTKGQDSVMLPLLTKLSDDDKVKIEFHLQKLYSNGLRTLVCGYAEQDRSWWTGWAEKYANALECPKDEKLEIFEKIEKDSKLQYLGMVGLEDQLQTFVPECIQDCFEAGIKVWMITGDKLAAAKNIAVACNLIDPDMVNDGAQKLNTRLIEITGKWYFWCRDNNALDEFFDEVNDKTPGSKVVNYSDIKKYFNYLAAPVWLVQSFEDDDKTTDQVKFRKKVKEIAEKQLTLQDAVQSEIDRGLDISGKNEFSILINREAFSVLFPDVENGTDTELRKNRTDTELRDNFLSLAMKSKSVVFARALPAMKKKIVIEIQKKYPKLITLAIGDGANDADMIRAAHVGVGISGVEGTAAVNVSDYALPQFRMLHTLLFVHGFWCYRRISYLVSFLCYKALFFVIPMVWFGIVSRFTPLRRWDFWSNTLYNLFYTSAPVMAIALWGQVLPRDVLQNNPSVYKSQKNTMFNGKVFSMWLSRSFFHGAIVWFISYYALCGCIIGQYGYTHGEKYFSLTMFMSLVMIVLIIGCFDMDHITHLNVLAIYMSYFTLWIVTPYLSFTQTKYSTYGVLGKMWGHPQFWLVMVLTISIPVILEFTIRSYVALVQPNEVMELRRTEIMKSGTTKLGEENYEKFHKEKKDFQEETSIAKTRVFYRWNNYDISGMKKNDQADISGFVIHDVIKS